MGNIPKIKAAADANGFILILPDTNPMQNCWDVGSTKALTHDGGGDTHAVAQMVRYALKQYNGDPARVYAHGGSSGAMMTQALMAIYPDIFRAGAARAGVPAGCWADGYDPSQQWSNNCAGGNTNKTPQQWGDQVRAMFPGYTGHRPRLQIMQGSSDTTISPKNTTESIDEWTNVLMLSMTPTSMDTGYKAANATYNRQFWKNACGYTVFEAWLSPGGTHSMPYEEADILKFLGLDVAGGADPEPDCPPGGTGGAGGGTGGAGGSTGSGGRGGSGGSVGSGGVGGQGRGGTAGPGTGGAGPGTGGISGPGTGGSATGTAGAAGTVGTGGSGTAGSSATGTGGSATGGAVGTGGATATGGSSAQGGRGGQGGVQGAAGSPATAGTTGSGTGTGGSPDDGGGGCAIAGQRGAAAGAVPLLLAALALMIRRRRRTRGR
jgi:poly(hydroxyalkanoate) depolymerase family esterase